MKRISTLSKFFGMLALVALMVCTFALCVSAASQSDIQDSMVVVVHSETDQYVTGIAIGKKNEPVRYILTSNEIASWGEQNATVYFSFATDSHVTGDIVYTDELRHICVVELPKETKEVKPAVFCPSNKTDFDGVFSAICHPTTIKTPWEKNKDKYVNVRTTIEDQTRVDNMTIYTLDIDDSRTTLCAPIVNENGEVVAVNLSNEGIYVGFALVSDEIIEALEDEGFPCTVSGDLDMILVIIIAAAVVAVVIIVLIIVLVVSKKKKKNINVSNASEVFNKTVSYDNNSAPVAPAVNTAPVAPAMRVISLGGVLNGKKFNVSGSVKIGRDASNCAIAYPVNTQGVSGTHCELTYDGTVCYLKDTKSSYGTFLADGTKLTPYAPQMLRSGDKFYLAGPENLFEVRF